MTAGRAIVGAVLLEALVGGAPPAGGDSQLGRWLVEEGRSYALSSQARGTKADARIVLSLMQAASSVAPHLGEAYRHQMELAQLLGEVELAREALAKYAVNYPADMIRQLAWLDDLLAEEQTAEDRLELLKLLIDRGESTAALIMSDVHRRAAELLYKLGRVAEADQHVGTALAMFPGNNAARQLRDGFHQEIPPEQAEAVYRLLRLDENPGSWADCIGLAKALDCLGLRGEAREWYERAVRLLERAEAEGSLLADVLVEMARSCKSEGKLDEARQWCQRAIEKNAGSVAARLLLGELCAPESEEESCIAVRKWLREYHERVAARLVEKPEAVQAASLSWYCGRMAGDVGRAVKYGEMALAQAPDNPVVRGCAGFAYLRSGQPERAVELLAASAGVDPMTAAGLGKALLQIGRQEEGLTLLREVVAGCATGAAYDEASAALKQAGQEPPPLPGTAQISTMLTEFDRSKLDFPWDPDRYVRFRVDLLAPLRDALAPWELVFVIENLSDFDITLGADRMLDPRAVVSFELGGAVEARFESYVRLTLDERPALRPGQVMRITRTVDTGTLREFLWRTTQVDYEVRGRALLDPVLNSEGKWVRSPFGPAPCEFGFRRPGLVATPSNLKRLLLASASEDPRARAPATEKLVALWAEYQAHQAGARPYQARPVPLDQIREAVAQRWNDTDQAVRLRTLGALRLIHLESADISSLAVLLYHEDPLTRMEAVLLMADQQGATFLPVVTGMAASDPGALARQLCGGFRDNWTSVEASAPRGGMDNRLRPGVQEGEWKKGLPY